MYQLQERSFKECLDNVTIPQQEPTTKVLRTAYYLAKGNQYNQSHSKGNKIAVNIENCFISIKSLLIENTSVSNKTTLIIYIPAYLAGNHPECLFLDLCELDAQEA